MPYLPHQQRVCRRCGTIYYVRCPNQAAHEEEDRQRQDEIEKREKQKEVIKEMIDSALDDITIPFFSTPHTCVWEAYGNNKHCCKVCGKVIFNNDHPELF